MQHGPTPWRRAAYTIALSIVLASCRPAAAPAAEPLVVLSSNGVRALVESLNADLQRVSQSTVTYQFSTAASLKQRIQNGEAFDVALLTPAILQELEASGLVKSGMQTFARTGVGVGVRSGAPLPNLDTPAALKAALLAASSVAYTAEGQSRTAVDRAFTTLGIVDAMAPKTRLLGPGQAPTAVAKGEADMVLTLSSEIVTVPGLQLAGSFPAPLNSEVSFAAGVSRQVRHEKAAEALVAFLASGDTSRALLRFGLER
jgi:molybdate transport system substrate-binding protein